MHYKIQNAGTVLEFDSILLTVSHALICQLL